MPFAINFLMMSIGPTFSVAASSRTVKVSGNSTGGLGGGGGGVGAGAATGALGVATVASAAGAGVRAGWGVMLGLGALGLTGGLLGRAAAGLGWDVAGARGLGAAGAGARVVGEDVGARDAGAFGFFTAGLGA